VTHLDHRKQPDRGARNHRSPRPNRPNRSRSAIGAAVVAGAAMVAAFAFILTNGPPDPAIDDGLRGGRDVTTPTAPPSADPAPSVNASKADRKPPATKPSAPAPNTGAESPTFRAGQFIAVLDSYPTDAGMAADQLARNLAAKLITAGVPAKAMLARGQYPGLSTSDHKPITDTWLVYLGPTTSVETALDLCVSPKTQNVHRNVACPTYEPAAR
jgi:hypothetical protein